MKIFLRDCGIAIWRNICLFQWNYNNDRKALQDTFKEHRVHFSRQRHQFLVNFGRTYILCREGASASMDRLWINDYRMLLLVNSIASLPLWPRWTSIITDKGIRCIWERLCNIWSHGERTTENIMPNKFHWWNRRMWNGGEHVDASNFAILWSTCGWYWADFVLYSRVGLHRWQCEERKNSSIDQFIVFLEITWTGWWLRSCVILPKDLHLPWAPPNNQQ